MTTRKLIYIYFLITFNFVGFSTPNTNQFLNETIFDISQTPNQKEWQTFFQSEKSFKMKLWHYHVKLGKDLGDWSWSWRIAWVKTCKLQTMRICKRIFKKALLDKAAVVRAEAATVLGEIYRGKKNKKIINMLAKTYHLQSNIRNNKPLFVQKRILYAILQIGGPLSNHIGTRLSKNHKANRQYWQKISKDRF